MNMERYYAERAIMHRRSLEGHKAELRGSLLDFRRPGSGMFAVRYRFDGPWLCVTGDVGAATYRYYPEISFGALANSSLEYFAGLCEASEYGRQFLNWDSDVCRSFLHEWFEENGEDVYGERPAKEFRESAEGAVGSCAEFDLFLDEHGYDAFGDEFWELSFGNVIADRCQIHHLGLRLAWEQRAGKVER